MRRVELGRAVGVAIFCAVPLLLVAAEARAQATYYIDESTDFTGNGCQNTDLNAVTSSLRTVLDNHSWSGSRFTNSSAWPQDFVEACSSSFGNGGLDDDFGDAASLAVYAGHGNSGSIQFGFARNSMCAVDMASSGNLTTRGVMRLGQMSGRSGHSAMWLTSCTLKKDRLAAKANFQWLRQQFGYHNSPSIGDDTPSEFYEMMANDVVSNKTAWLEAMEDRPGLFTGDNSPIVVSYGSTSAEATDTHNNFRYEGRIIFPRPGGPACGGGPPAFFFVSTLRDNGTSSTCQ
jgi:hypothetical protein